MVDFGLIEVINSLAGLAELSGAVRQEVLNKTDYEVNYYICKELSTAQNIIVNALRFAAKALKPDSEGME